MSYSQYRQRNESGKTVPLGTSLLMSSRKESNNVSEDEQSTQEGTFTGYNNRSSYQPLSSMKRNSKMGRLKTAPLPIRLATINFDEEEVDEDNEESNIDHQDNERVPVKPVLPASTCTPGAIAPRNAGSKSSALSLVASMHDRQNYPRKVSMPMQQRREPLSHRDNKMIIETKHQTQPSKYSTHLGKSPIKRGAIREVDSSTKKDRTAFSRSPEKKFPPPVRSSPNKHTSSLIRRHHVRQQMSGQEIPSSQSRDMSSSVSQSCLTSTSDYNSSSLYSNSNTQKKTMSPVHPTSQDNPTSKSRDLEFSNKQQVTSTELHSSASYIERSSCEKDKSQVKTESVSVKTDSATSLEKQITEANNSISRMQQDTIYIKDKSYTLLGKIGKGGSSVVYRAIDENNQMRAIKKVDLSELDHQQAEDFKNEISHLERLKGHERIIEIFGWEQKICRDGEFLFVVMECGEKDLGTLLKELSAANKGLTDNKIKFYWEEMLEAVQVIHNGGIVHRDLKPGNFVIVGGRIKLIDFGIAKAMADDKTHITISNLMGTFNFMSPEVINHSQNDSGENVVKFNCKADVWSLGCILYNMIYKKMPFGHIKDPFKKIQAICNPEHEIKLNDNELAGHDPTVNEVLRLCLVRDPSKRGSIEDLLEHKYLKSQSSDTPNLPKHKSMQNMLMQISSFSPRTSKAFLEGLKHIQNK